MLLQIWPQPSPGFKGSQEGDWQEHKRRCAHPSSLGNQGDAAAGPGRRSANTHGLPQLRPPTEISSVKRLMRKRYTYEKQTLPAPYLFHISSSVFCGKSLLTYVHNMIFRSCMFNSIHYILKWRLSKIIFLPLFFFLLRLPHSIGTKHLNFKSTVNLKITLICCLKLIKRAVLKLTWDVF